MYIFQNIYIYESAQEVTAHTVFMVWLRAWIWFIILVRETLELTTHALDHKLHSHTIDLGSKIALDWIAFLNSPQ
jgi:hypothetical protein